MGLLGSILAGELNVDYETAITSYQIIDRGYSLPIPIKLEQIF